MCGKLYVRRRWMMKLPAQKLAVALSLLVLFPLVGSASAHGAYWRTETVGGQCTSSPCSGGRVFEYFVERVRYFHDHELNKNFELERGNPTRKTNCSCAAGGTEITPAQLNQQDIMPLSYLGGVFAKPSDCDLQKEERFSVNTFLDHIRRTALASSIPIYITGV